MSKRKKDWLSVKEFAEEFGCSTDRVYEWIRTGLITTYPRLTKQSKHRIPRTELQRLKSGIPNLSSNAKSTLNEAQEEHRKRL